MKTRQSLLSGPTRGAARAIGQRWAAVLLLFGTASARLGYAEAAESPPQIQPSITFQHTAVNVRQTNIFTVVATGDALSYQWRLNGQPLPGETGQTCLRTNARPADEGDYTVVITNAFGAITSAPARLYVAPPASDYIKRNFTGNTGLRLPYWYLLPANYNAARSYPLRCMLHGQPGGETMMTNANPAGAGYLNYAHLKVFASYQQQATDPMIEVWPARRAEDVNGTWTQDYLGLVSGMLDALISEFSVDTNRVYVSGASEGVHAAWDLIGMRPGFFAAGSVSAGAGGTTPAASVKDVPLWLWCALDDSVWAVDGIRSLVAALRQVGANPIHTEYRSGSHLGGIGMGYATPAYVDWQLAQRRGVPSTAPPLLSITSPTTEPAFATTVEALDLAGSAQTSGETVTGITWENLLNNTAGLASGGNTWSVTGIPLEPLETNPIRLTATTTTGSAGYGGNTTFSTMLSVLRVYDRLVIGTQPTDQFALPGSNVTFSVAAYSLAPITYQWQRNGTNILHATNNTLTLTNVQLADESVFSVVVTDGTDPVPSDPAHLWILINPVILQPPLSQTVVQGGNVTLSAVISGNPPPFSFQWRRGTATVLTNITQNERTCFLTVTRVQANQGGLHRLIVTNAASPSPLGVFVTFSLTVLADTDADGLPDVWEEQYGIADPAADNDGDGFTNGQEYTAGTDPTNALSCLTLDSIALAEADNSVALRFFAVSNKTYTVQCRDSLDNGEWIRLSDVVAVSSNRVLELLDLAPGLGTPRRVYRLATPRAP